MTLSTANLLTIPTLNFICCSFKKLNLYSLESEFPISFVEPRGNIRDILKTQFLESEFQNFFYFTSQLIC